MKRNCIWIVVLVFGFVSCALTEAAMAAEEKEITVVGVIEKSKRLNYVNTGSDKYRLIGQDFSNLIGKKLKVTGKLTRSHGDKTLLVTYMEFVRN